ncbi:MAG: alpha/beta hydrolase [Fibrobacter sp.]|nr:alpha/beta hydrolase [Fibrobacter sp.]
MKALPAKDFLPPLNLQNPPLTSKFIKVYTTFYRLNFPETVHYTGIFDSGAYSLTAHVFLPRTINGTLFLVHGLFDHSPYFRHIIALCNSLGIATCLFDLPGHGLSSGKPVEINDFHSYGQALKNLVFNCTKVLPPPYHLLGHSTGCCAIIDFLFLHAENFIPDQIIFLAPLVRITHWRLCRALIPPLSRFIGAFPRIHRKTSSDSVFLEQVKNDPLQYRLLPLCWFKNLINWNTWLNNQCKLNKKITMISGTDDTIVDWNYNSGKLDQLFSADKVEIPGAKHHLHNECTEFRSKVLSIIQNKISNN